MPKINQVVVRSERKGKKEKDKTVLSHPVLSVMIAQVVPNYLLFIWRNANVNFLERLYEPSNLVFAKVIESIL